MKFALFVSNRTTFPQQLVAEAIDNIASAVKKAGYIPILPLEGVADDAGALR